MDNDNFYETDNILVPKGDYNIVAPWWDEVIHKYHFIWIYRENDGRCFSQVWGNFDDLLAFAREQDVQWEIRRDKITIAQTKGYRSNK